MSRHGGVRGEGLGACFGQPAARERVQSWSHKNGPIVEPGAENCLDMFEFILKYVVRNLTASRRVRRQVDYSKDGFVFDAVQQGPILTLEVRF